MPASEPHPQQEPNPSPPLFWVNSGYKKFGWWPSLVFESWDEVVAGGHPLPSEQAAIERIREACEQKCSKDRRVVICFLVKGQWTSLRKGHKKIQPFQSKNFVEESEIQQQRINDIIIPDSSRTDDNVEIRRKKEYELFLTAYKLASTILKHGLSKDVFRSIQREGQEEENNDDGHCPTTMTTEENSLSKQVAIVEESLSQPVITEEESLPQPPNCDGQIQKHMRDDSAMESSSLASTNDQKQIQESNENDTVLPVPNVSARRERDDDYVNLLLVDHTIVTDPDQTRAEESSLPSSYHEGTVLTQESDVTDLAQESRVDEDVPALPVTEEEMKEFDDAANFLLKATSMAHRDEDVVSVDCGKKTKYRANSAISDSSNEQQNNEQTGSLINESTKQPTSTETKVLETPAVLDSGVGETDLHNDFREYNDKSAEGDEDPDDERSTATNNRRDVCTGADRTQSDEKNLPPSAGYERHYHCGKCENVLGVESDMLNKDISLPWGIPLKCAVGVCLSVDKAASGQKQSDEANKSTNSMLTCLKCKRRVGMLYSETLDNGKERLLYILQRSKTKIEPKESSSSAVSITDEEMVDSSIAHRDHSPLRDGQFAHKKDAMVKGKADENEAKDKEDKKHSEQCGQTNNCTSSVFQCSSCKNVIAEEQWVANSPPQTGASKEMERGLFFDFVSGAHMGTGPSQEDFALGKGQKCNFFHLFCDGCEKNVGRFILHVDLHSSWLRHQFWLNREAVIMVDRSLTQFPVVPAASKGLLTEYRSFSAFRCRKCSANVAKVSAAERIQRMKGFIKVKRATNVMVDDSQCIKSLGFSYFLLHCEVCRARLGRLYVRVSRNFAPKFSSVRNVFLLERQCIVPSTAPDDSLKNTKRGNSSGASKTMPISRKIENSNNDGNQNETKCFEPVVKCTFSSHSDSEHMNSKQLLLSSDASDLQLNFGDTSKTFRCINCGNFLAKSQDVLMDSRLCCRGVRSVSSGVKISDTLETVQSSDSKDFGCKYRNLFCVQCGHTVGRKYSYLVQDLSALIGYYSLLSSATTMNVSKPTCSEAQMSRRSEAVRKPDNALGDNEKTSISPSPTVPSSVRTSREASDEAGRKPVDQSTAIRKTVKSQDCRKRLAVSADRNSAFSGRNVSIFQCVTCKTVISDSFALIGTDAALRVFIVSGVSGVDLDMSRSRVAQDGSVDAGCRFVEMLCRMCEKKIGVIYTSTTKNFLHLRGLYLLQQSTVSKKIVGIYDIGDAKADDIFTFHGVHNNKILREIKRNQNVIFRQNMRISELEAELDREKSKKKRRKKYSSDSSSSKSAT